MSAELVVRSPLASLPRSGTNLVLRDMDTKRKVEVVFIPEEEGGFSVLSPDLPGMHTQGETLEEASRMAEEAIALYVESMRGLGREVPVPVVRRDFPIPG